MAARKGDSVLLVSLTVFVGYLYVTRRLQAVFDVLKGPAPGTAAATVGGGQIAPQGQGGLGIPKAPWQYTPPIAPAPVQVDPYTSDPRNLPPKWRAIPRGFYVPTQ